MSKTSLKTTTYQISFVVLLIAGIFPLTYGSGSNEMFANSPIRPVSTEYIYHPTIIISSESNIDSYAPDIAVDSRNNIHVVWEDQTDYNNSGSDSDIFYKQFNNITQSWENVSVITSESTTPSYAPKIAVDSKNNLHVVWTEYPDFTGDVDIFYKKFTNATKTWGSPVEVSSETTRDSYNKAIAIDSFDNIHVIWTVVEPAVYGYMIDYRVFNANSNSWGTTRLLSNETTSSTSEPDLIVDHNDNLHAVWVDGTNYNGAGTDKDIIYKKIADTGWSAPFVISEGSNQTSSAPQLAVDSDNNIHVVWSDPTNMDATDTAYDRDILYRSLNSSSGVWNAVSLLSTESGTSIDSDFPDIYAKNNDLHVIWNDRSDYFGAGGDEDIFYKRLDFATGIWQSTKVVSTESSGNSQYSRIVVDSTNNIHIVWEDDSNLDPPSVDFDIFYRLFEEDTILNSLNNPDDVVYELGSTGNTLQWVAIDPNPTIYNLYRNGQLMTPASWSSNIPIVVPIDELSVGLYNYTIIVFDAVGNSRTDTVNVLVEDTTKPVFNQTPNNLTFTSGSLGNVLSWMVTDYDPSEYIAYLNGIEFTSGIWISTENIMINIDLIPEGTHNFTIVISDTSSNMAIDTVSVTVIPITNTTTTNSISTTSTTSSINPSSEVSSTTSISITSDSTNTSSSDFLYIFSFFSIILLKKLISGKRSK